VTDRIEKTVIVKAPRSHVWRAISDAKLFGQWFKVQLDGEFKAGTTINGTITYPGYEGLTLEMVVERIEPERFFSYRWHPGESQARLPRGADDARRVHARGRRCGHASHYRRIGIRQDPAGSPRRGVPHERRRLDRAVENIQRYVAK
jgi:uncharacterized protein YndB with AHSA1/START domain